MRNEDINGKDIERQQIKWFCHLMRMEPTQPALHAYNRRRSGFKARGRPRTRWVDSITEMLQKYGLTMARATHVVKDRKLQLPHDA